MGGLVTNEKSRKIRKFKYIIFIILVFRFSLSGFVHGGLTARYEDFDMSVFEWVFRDTFPLFFMVSLIFIVPYLYGYVVHYSEKFRVNGLVVGSVLFTPLLILMIVMFGIGRDSFPTIPSSDAQSFPTMPMDVRVLIGFINDIAYFLRSSIEKPAKIPSAVN